MRRPDVSGPPTPASNATSNAAVLALRAPLPSRSPWQLFYGWGHRVRRHFLGRRARVLPRPVVSVGNLHWGGSGKTPVTAAIAAHLRDAGHRVAILSRGYGRPDRDVRVVSRGQGPLLGPLLVGDEPVLLAGLLPEVAVVVGADRHRAGHHALERLTPPPDLFLLDDGFSHLRLARDLDLLTFPWADPFAGGRLLPGGRLREPLAASAHADAVLLTGQDVPEDGGYQLARALRRYGFAGPGFTVKLRLGRPHLLSGEILPPAARVLLVSAIARPQPFFQGVHQLGCTVVDHLIFPDHHPYPPATLEQIRRAFHASAAEAVLTTGKDRVKLQGRLEEPLAEVPLTAELEPDFFRWLNDRLAELRQHGRLARAGSGYP